MTLTGSNRFENLSGLVPATGSNRLGGAIYNNRGSLSINGATFSSNKPDNAFGGAIYTYGSNPVDINATFRSNQAIMGGAIYITGGTNVTVAGLYSDNKAASDGGAIYSDSSFTVKADGGNTTFTNNKSNDGDVSNAIYMATANTTLNMNALNRGVITFNDAIDGVGVYNLVINGDNRESRVEFNEKILKANLSVNNVYTLIDHSDFDIETEGEENLKDTTLTVNSGTLDVKKVILNHYTTNDGTSASNINVVKPLAVPDPVVIPALNISNSKVFLSKKYENEEDNQNNLADAVYMGKLTSNANNEFSIDVIFSDDYTVNEDGSLTYNVPNTSDTIQVESGSTGTVTLTNINFMNINSTNDGIIQILKGAGVDADTTITLALSDKMRQEYVEKGWTYSIDPDGELNPGYITPDNKVDVKFSDFIGTRKISLYAYETPGTQYDSLKVVSNRRDALAAVNQYDGSASADRTFRFTDEHEREIYYLTENTGVTATGLMNVLGIANNENIIDGGDIYSMFVVSQPATELNISNVIIQNVKVGTNNTASVLNISDQYATDAVVNLSNVTLRSNRGNSIYNTVGTVNFRYVTVAADGGNLLNGNNFTFEGGINRINSQLTNNATVESKPGSTNYYSGKIVANNEAKFKFGGDDFIDSEIKLAATGNTPEFDISGTTTVTPNSNLNEQSIKVNIEASGNLVLDGSEAVINTSGTGNDVWNTTGTITLANHEFTDEEGTVTSTSEAVLKYTGTGDNTDLSFNNGVIQATSGKFELVSGNFDVLEVSNIADEVKVLLTSGNFRASRNGLRLGVDDKWSTNANVYLSEQMNFYVAEGLNGNSVLNLTDTSKLYSDAEGDATLARFVNEGVTINVTTYEDEAYKGVYTQLAGKLIIENSGRVFGEYDGASAEEKVHSLKDIQGGEMIVNYTTRTIDYGNVLLGSGAKLTNTSLGGDVNEELLTFNGDGAEATFKQLYSAVMIIHLLLM